MKAEILWRVTMRDREFKISANANLSSLDHKFTRNEIDNVVKELPTDRSPGSDGFNTFLKRCWHIIKLYFYKLIDNFFSG